MDVQANKESVADRQFTITRVYDAPARLLFLAHSKPEHVRRWFGPKGWPISKCEMDFRVGGEFHMQMTSDEGELGPPSAAPISKSNPVGKSSTTMVLKSQAAAGFRSPSFSRSSRAGRRSP